MKKDLDYIKEKFDNCEVNAPAYMDEKFVLSRLEKNEPQLVPIKPKRSYRRIIAAAASFVAVCGLSALIIAAVFSSNNSTGLKRFQSYDEIKAAVHELDDIREICLYGDTVDKNVYDAESGVDAELSFSNASGTKNPASDYGELSHSSTYKQVEAVDEADIVKTDGRYIFCVEHSLYEGIKIFSAESGESETKLRPQFESGKLTDDGSGKYSDLYISEMFLRNDRLIVICQGYYHPKMRTENQMCTAAFVYDVSDIHNIKQLDVFSQSGDYSSSRMIGDKLYLVSVDYGIYGDRIVPECGRKCTVDQLPADCVYSFEKPSDNSFLVVSAYNTLDFSKQVETKAILGAAETVYCNESNMYITSSEWENDDGYYGWGNKTGIVKAELSEEITFTAYAQVDGFVNNQYSLDEYNGNLRVASTSVNDDGNDVNHLFVLDEKLNVIGSVTDFAEDESIKAVKYVAETAYVITYEETDPLFVIDLSKPEKPAILGSVEISGFSSMLVPIDENTILGLGYHTEQNDSDFTDMEIQSGFKLALFDVSDKTNPKVLDSKSYVDFYSPVMEDPKALVYNVNRNDYVIPLNYSKYTEDKYGIYETEENGGMLNFKVENGKIAEVDRYQSSHSETQRCLYVGDRIYMTCPGSSGAIRLEITEYMD